MFWRIGVIASIVLASILIIIFCYSKVQENTSLAQLFPKDSSIAQEFANFNAAFGTNDILLVTVTSSDKKTIFTPQALALIDEITVKLESLDDFETVVSVTNLQDFEIERTPKWIPFAPKYRPTFPSEYISKPYENLLEGKKEKLKNDPFLLSGLMSEDANTAAIWLLLKPELKNKTDFLKRMEKIASEVPQSQNKNLQVRTTGFPLIQAASYKALKKDGFLFFFLSLLFALVVFIVCRASWQCTMALFLSCFPVIALWILCMMLLKSGLHFFSNIVPPFFLITVIPTLLYIDYATRTGEDQKVTIKASALVTATTAIGFLTLIFSPLTPLQNIGIEIPLVVSFVFIFATLFFILLSSSVKPRAIKKIALRYNFSGKWQGAILVVAVLSAFPWFLWKKSPPVYMDFLDYLPPKHLYVQDTHFVRSTLKAENPFEVIVSFDSKDVSKIWRDNETYFLMEKFQIELQEVSQNKIKEVFSPATLAANIEVKIANANKTKPEFKVSDESCEFIITWFVIPFLKFFSHSDPKKMASESSIIGVYYNKMRQLISTQGDSIRFGCRVANLDPQEVLTLKKKLEQELFPKYKKLFGAKEIYATGYSVLISETAQGIHTTQTTSLVFGSILIAILMLFFIHSFMLWFLAVATNIAAFLVFFNFLVLGNFPINLYNTILLAAVIGTMVDNTLRFLIAYDHYRKIYDVQKALEETIQSVVPMAIWSSLTLALGLGVFWFSDVPVYRGFVVLGQIGIALALFWDILVFPILVIFWEKLYARYFKLRDKQK